MIARCLLGIPWCFGKNSKAFYYLLPLFFAKSSWIVIGFGLDCQSILKIGFGFGFSIIYLLWIRIGLTIQNNWIEQYPDSILFLFFLEGFVTQKKCKKVNKYLFRKVSGGPNVNNKQCFIFHFYCVSQGFRKCLHCIAALKNVTHFKVFKSDLKIIFLLLSQR